MDLRVTFAHMIEPNPGRPGMLGRYSYAFQRRLAEQEEHERDGIGNPKAFESHSHWLIGPRCRNLGSLHTDISRGSAAELLDCGTLAVYPVGGW